MMRRSTLWMRSALTWVTQKSMTHAFSGLAPGICSPLSRPPSRDAAPPARIATVRAGCIATSALTALGVADHALAPLLLSFGQLVAIAGVWIFLLAEIDADRRAFELVALAEE